MLVFNLKASLCGLTTTLSNEWRLTPSEDQFRAAVAKEHTVGSLGTTFVVALFAATLPVGLAIVCCGKILP